MQYLYFQYNSILPKESLVGGVKKIKQGSIKKQNLE